MKSTSAIKSVCIIILIFTSIIYATEKDRIRKYNSYALWGQFSVGGLDPDIKVEYHPRGFVKLEANGFYRRKNLLLSGGYVHSVTEAWKITNTWLALGWGKYNKIGEISVNGGISYSGWSHQLWEGELIESANNFGTILKFNGLLHLIDGFAGIGLDYTIQHSPEIQYKTLSFFIALGNWNL